MAAIANLTLQDAPIDDQPAQLSPALVRKIDCALRRAGQFGEVRLVIQKGKVRFIQVVQSEDVRDVPA
jgi:hypothetical protein